MPSAQDRRDFRVRDGFILDEFGMRVGTATGDTLAGAVLTFFDTRYFSYSPGVVHFTDGTRQRSVGNWRMLRREDPV